MELEVPFTCTWKEPNSNLRNHSRVFSGKFLHFKLFIQENPDTVGYRFYAHCFYIGYFF
jgi:hypothetical protein